VKPSRTALVILPSLVLVNLALLFLSTSQLLQTGVPTMTIEWGLIPISLTDSLVNGSVFDIGYDLLTLLTCTFLHGSFDHFFSNMLMLYVFGMLVERQLGACRFLTLYVASGILASLGHYVLAPMSPYPMIGASGAISGVMGAFLICAFASGKRITILPVLGAVFIVQWVVEQAFSAMATPARISGSAVAYDAHLTGFFAGLLVAGLMVLRMRRNAARLTVAEDQNRSDSDSGSGSIDWQKIAKQLEPGAVETKQTRSESGGEDRAIDALDDRTQRLPERESNSGSADTQVQTGKTGESSGTADQQLVLPKPDASLDSDQYPLTSDSKGVISAKTDSTASIANERVREASPAIKRPAQPGYQPDKNDTLLG
jgi:membrane associated rhomboid family serine protease